MELPLGIYEEITGLDELPPPVDEADHERRRHRRVPFGCRATIFPERKGGDNTPGVAMVRDMSVGGLSLLISEPLKPPTPFVLEFRGRKDRPVKIRCITARCETGGFGGTQYVVGAMFDELLTTVLTPEELHKVEAPPAPLAEVQAGKVQTEESAEPVSEELIEEALRDLANPADAGPALELIDKDSPEKASSSLFIPGSRGKAKRLLETPDEESNETAPAPDLQAATTPPEEVTPVFRVIPIAEEPEKTAVMTMELGPQDSGKREKNHEVLVRVKELLVKQEQSIESQRQELKEQRERFEKEIEAMRSELEEAKKMLAELQSKSEADDSAIAELASFLRQHGGGDSPARTTEAA